MLRHCELSPQFYWARGGVHKGKSTGPLQYHSKMSVFSYRIVHNLYYSLQFPHISHKTVHAHEFGHMFFCRVTIPLILRGLKIVKYIHYIVRVGRQKSLSGLIKHRWPKFLFWLQISQYRLLQSWIPRVMKAPHVAQFRLRSHANFFFDVFCGSRNTFGS